MNYLEFNFEIEPLQPASEILIAELGLAGFESFVENESGITAYIPEEEFEEDSLAGIQILQSDEFTITYTSRRIEQVNWNEEWEKNFHPILVEDSCCVRAPLPSAGRCGIRYRDRAQDVLWNRASRHHPYDDTVSSEQ